MTFETDYSNQAKKFLKKCEKSIATRILKSVEQLQVEPKPHGIKKVEGSGDLYRIRIGDYRVLYEVDYSRNLLGIVKIDKRPRVYQGI